jgi:hypothetical protein
MNPFFSLSLKNRYNLWQQGSLDTQVLKRWKKKVAPFDIDRDVPPCFFLDNERGLSINLNCVAKRQERINLIAQQEKYLCAEFAEN